MLESEVVTANRVVTAEAVLILVFLDVRIWAVAEATEDGKQGTVLILVFLDVRIWEVAGCDFLESSGRKS